MKVVGKFAMPITSAPVISSMILPRAIHKSFINGDSPTLRRRSSPMIGRMTSVRPRDVKDRTESKRLA